MSEQRGTPVTLEEMTRRRDGWRARYEELERRLKATVLSEMRATAAARQAERAVHNHTSIVARLQQRATAAEAQARRFAEECGRLRNALATADAECERLRDRMAEWEAWLDDGE